MYINVYILPLLKQGWHEKATRVHLFSLQVSKMINVFEKLTKTFSMNRENLEEYLWEMGISFRSYTVYVNTGKKRQRVSVDDIVRYYAFEAQNLSSGIRTLGTINGDWQRIDNLAKICLLIYKVLKRDELQKMAHKFGMELKDRNVY